MFSVNQAFAAFYWGVIKYVKSVLVDKRVYNTAATVAISPAEDSA